MINIIKNFRLGFFCCSMLLIINCQNRKTSSNNAIANASDTSNIEENNDKTFDEVQDTPLVASIVATDVRLRSAPDISDSSNIVGVAQRGDRVQVLDSTSQFQKIGDYGLNRWFKVIHGGENEAWVFGGLTSLAVDGIYGLNKRNSLASMSKPEIIVNDIPEESTFDPTNLMAELYVLSAVDPDMMTTRLKLLNYSEVQAVKYACNKIANCLEPSAKSAAEMRNDMARANERLNSQLGAMGISPNQHSLASDSPITFTYWWVAELYNVLENNLPWENTISYTNTSLTLSSFKMIHNNSNLMAQFGGYSNNMFDQMFQDFTNQVSEQTLKIIIEDYLQKIRYNCENYVIYCLR